MEKTAASAWLSRGFEELLCDQANAVGPRGLFDFDVVVVGSGYGGAVAAAQFAGCKGADGRRVSLCVLERGREYFPGMFPSRLAELPGHVRFATPGAARPRGVREGLFDVRIGPDVCAVLGNGLGGGSLINAGVMEPPDPRVWEDPRWPPAREACYACAARLVGAADARGPNTILRHESPAPRKYRALEKLAPARTFRPAAITVAMDRKTTGAGVSLSPCNGCGDCATGCNHGAKESLDVNLLASARRRGAELYTGATVSHVRKEGEGWRSAPGWVLHVVHTDEKLRAREGAPLLLRARHVVLAAGAFGSTEILLRSQSEALRFSPRLGQGFSANGDMLAVAYRQSVEANAVADETVLARKRGVGPTITGIVDLRVPGGGHLVEEMAIPGPLGRAFEETAATVHALHGLTRPDTCDHEPGNPDQVHDPLAIDPAAVRSSLVLAVMGRDDARGAFELAGDGDGTLVVRWPELRDAPLFGEQIRALEALAKASTGGAILANPLWRLLPESLQFLLDGGRGPLLTVHPLGGCGMGADADEGVVDHAGRVFAAGGGPGGAKRVHPGLVVLDGAIVPCALGTNPALTITALALHAVEALRGEWQYRDGQGDGAELPARPAFRRPAEAPPPKATEVQFIERLSGPVTLRDGNGVRRRCVAELTLPFEPCTVASLVRPGRVPAALERTLRVAQSGERRGELRVFREEAWEQWRRDGEPEPDSDERYEGLLVGRAGLTGTLTFFHRERSTRLQRTVRALWAYWMNRGARDTWQWVVQRLREDGPLGFFVGTARKGRSGNPLDDRLCADIRRRWRDALALASRAGEVRLFEYRLALGEVSLDALGLLEGHSAPILGKKRLTYARRANPWRQLMAMQLATFPGLAGDEAPILELDLKYLARERVPLVRIVGQQDQPSALADLASLGVHFVRLLLSLHVWSFRRPDTPEPREPQRLPGLVPGLPAPVIRELQVDALPDGAPVMVRLTRYRRRRAGGRPVVLIHGYSASGTTFAHRAVRPNLAEWLCDEGRDVWVLDLRTSSGMPTARHPWTFEDAALKDLPAAIARIRAETGEAKLDVVAHCMGAAMLGMAVLKRPSAGERYFREREALPQWIHRAVLSQIAPVVVMSPANVFRAYALTYLRYFLPLGNYDFRVKQDPGLLDQLIDRLLATVPYPEWEFDAENPPWRFWRRTPFVGTRHRMDALYGRDFSLADRHGRPLLDERVLEDIDDLFGPLSIDTVAQGIHFARMQVIATRAGRNDYVNAQALRERWKFRTLSIHGTDNGLADIATLARIHRILNAEGRDRRFDTLEFEGFGHQDSLIGRKAPQVFEAIARFLAAEDDR